MILSIFDHLNSCETTECIFSKLLEINCKLFQRLLDIDENNEEDRVYTKGEAALIIRYILYAYSEKSPFLVLGADFHAEKIAIAERIKLETDLYEDVIEMRSAKVRNTIVDYIDAQSNRAFKFLCFKKDMYEKAMAQGVRDMGSDSFDIKAMQEHNKYMGQLQLDIIEYEDQLRSEYRYVYENKEEINSIGGKSKRDFGHLENSQYIT